MKLKDGLILRYVDGLPMVVAIGKMSMRFNGIINLNESGVILWKLLAQGAEEAELIAALQTEYVVDAAEATADVQAFVHALREAQLLDDEHGM